MNAFYEDEVAEFDEIDEQDERAKRFGRRFPALRIPRPGNITAPAVSSRPVTRSEFASATRKLDEKIGVNSRGIKTVEGRVNTVADANARQGKTIKTLQGEIKSVREISMLLPLLSSQKTAVVAGTEVVVPSDDTFAKLLPLLLMSGGMGGLGGGNSADSNSGLGGMMLPLILILSANK